MRAKKSLAWAWGGPIIARLADGVDRSVGWKVQVAMASRRENARSADTAKWLIVILLSVIATCLLIEVGFGTSAARADVMAEGADHVIAVAGKVGSDSYGLYLLDLKNRTITVYQYVSGKRTLRLMAGRNISFDVQLDEYNTEPPPSEIQKLVQQHKRLGQ